MINVVIVDDQILFTESLRLVLELDNSNIHVLATAHDGREALQIVRDMKPEVVLIDVRMPGLDGVETTKILKIEFPEIKIILLTTFEDDESIDEALRFGADGYLLKSIDPHELSRSIDAVCNGDVIIAPKFAHKLHENGLPDNDSVKNPYLLDRLSRRELEIVQLIARGLGNKQISSLLQITDQTVRNNVSGIYAKLDVHSRYEAVRRAAKAGLLGNAKAK